ncbi:MAG: hypothetical protein RL077_3349, partial [Verrucomicrobiota bacterium]
CASEGTTLFPLKPFNSRGRRRATSCGSSASTPMNSGRKSSAVPADPVALQRLQPASRRDTQEIKAGRSVRLSQLSACHSLHRMRETARAVLQLAGVVIGGDPGESLTSSQDAEVTALAGVVIGGDPGETHAGEEDPVLVPAVDRVLEEVSGDRDSYQSYCQATVSSLTVRHLRIPYFHVNQATRCCCCPQTHSRGWLWQLFRVGAGIGHECV